jgi:hypothetical protein
VLVDGFHRVEALIEVGRTEVEAVVTPATRAVALWLAVQGNMAHGLQLTAQEKREGFRRYIRADQHVKPNGRLKSYREIGSELSRPHTTVQKWMATYFPKIAAKMRGGDQPMGNGGLREDKRRTFASVVLEHARGIRTAGRGKMSPENRTWCIKETEEALQALREAGPWTPDDF